MKENKKEEETKQTEEKVEEKLAYDIADIPTQTAPMIVDVKENKVISNEEVMKLLLNKVDRIEKAIVGKS